MWDAAFYIGGGERCRMRRATWHQWRKNEVMKQANTMALKSTMLLIIPVNWHALFLLLNVLILSRENILVCISVIHTTHCVVYSNRNQNVLSFCCSFQGGPPLSLKALLLLISRGLPPSLKAFLAANFKGPASPYKSPLRGHVTHTLLSWIGIQRFHNWFTAPF